MRSVGNMQKFSAVRKPVNVRVTTLAHQIWGQLVSQGDVVVDATCGRGADTFWLAHAVGPQGVVYALDIQVGQRFGFRLTIPHRTHRYIYRITIEEENGSSPTTEVFAARDVVVREEVWKGKRDAARC